MRAIVDRVLSAKAVKALRETLALAQIFLRAVAYQEPSIPPPVRSPDPSAFPRRP